MMLSPVIPHAPPGAPELPADQLVVMGRFTLADVSNEAVSQLKFHVGLFGEQPEGQTLEITSTRAVGSKQFKHKITLTPKQSEGQLFKGRLN